MSRKAMVLSCTEKEKQQLERWANGAKIERSKKMIKKNILSYSICTHPSPFFEFICYKLLDLLFKDYGIPLRRP